MNPNASRGCSISLMQMGLKVSVAHLEEHQGELVGVD